MFANNRNHTPLHHALVSKQGLAGLSYANGKTHAQMHQDRLEFLQSMLKL